MNQSTPDRMTTDQSDGKEGVGAWTPGPWLRDGLRVEMQSGEMLFWSDGGYGGSGHPDADGEAEANAHLIASAPELYEALERIAAGLDGASAAKVAKRALARARGESQ